MRNGSALLSSLCCAMSCIAAPVAPEAAADAISNDVPYITWSPNLNTNGVVRKYTFLGKESLADNVEWAPTNSVHRFFKVRVEMP